jgi:hypothetical protein
MALVPKDADRNPEYFGGADRLATEALGKTADEAGLRAVSRAIKALEDLGLLAREGHGRHQSARYRLLDGGIPPQPLSTGRSPSDANRSAHDAHRPAQPARTRRSAVPHTTVSVPTHDAERPALIEEKRKEEEGAPTPTCTRHSTWHHDEPCRACRNDREAADAWRPPKRPPRPHNHRFDDISGYCDCGLREDQP